MGTSKKKSSFRIDDLLQQQNKIATSATNGQHRHHPFYTQNQHITGATMLNAYYSAFPSVATKPSNGSSHSPQASHPFNNNHKAQHNHQPPPIAHHPKIHHQPQRHAPSLSIGTPPTSASDGGGHPSPRSPSATSPTGSQKPRNANPSPTFADGNATSTAPHKPMPMYVPPPPQNAMMDLHKASFCFPPMAMTMPPPYSHAAAAYLEHYANSFQKGRGTTTDLVTN